MCFLVGATFVLARQLLGICVVMCSGVLRCVVVSNCQQKHKFSQIVVCGAQHVAKPTRVVAFFKY